MQEEVGPEQWQSLKWTTIGGVQVQTMTKEQVQTTKACRLPWPVPHPAPSTFCEGGAQHAEHWCLCQSTSTILVGPA